MKFDPGHPKEWFEYCTQITDCLLHVLCADPSTLPLLSEYNAVSEYENKVKRLLDQQPEHLKMIAAGIGTLAVRSTRPKQSTSLTQKAYQRVVPPRMICWLCILHDNSSDAQELGTCTTCIAREWCASDTPHPDIKGFAKPKLLHHGIDDSFLDNISFPEI